MSQSLTLNKTTYKTLAAAGAVLTAVALPQMFHVVGAVSGLGSALGETFLPMHLPVLLVGLLAGPLVGMIAGALSPLISYAFSGMPTIIMLPFIMIELTGYGLAAGALSNKKMPVFFKLLLVQVAGRACRAAAMLIAVYGLGSQALQAAGIWHFIAVGLPGILLQWALIPLLIFWIERTKQI